MKNERWRLKIDNRWKIKDKTWERYYRKWWMNNDICMREGIWFLVRESWDLLAHN